MAAFASDGSGDRTVLDNLEHGQVSAESAGPRSAARGRAIGDER